MKGSDGSPVANADVAVVVVDEAVLALTGYKLPDPISAMYPAQDANLSADYLRNSLVLANPNVFGGVANSVAKSARNTAPKVFPRSPRVALARRARSA